MSKPIRRKVKYSSIYHMEPNAKHVLSPAEIGLVLRKIDDGEKFLPMVVEVPK